MVPIRPFVAEFTAKYAGYTCQEVAHDYELAFAAARRCAAEFDWDAVVSNMVYVWTGLTQAIGLKYYGIPGIDIPADTGFQYREPPQNDAYMQPEEYDALIADPTGFLLNVWLPRVAAPVRAPGEPTTTANHLSFLKGGMAMMKYFAAFGTQNALLRSECGTVSAIAGIFKAPMDIIADKLRGYLGLVDDLFERRDKVVAACEALMPHLFHVAHTSADPQRLVPIGYWMHRGGVPFVSPEIFKNVYWATVKPIIEELWAHGHQTLFYAEGKWDHHLESFAELPERSIVYHVDQGDVEKAASRAGREVLLERRHSQLAAHARQAGGRAAAGPQGAGNRRRRRGLYPRRQRHRAERRHDREHAGHDRRRPRVRRLLFRLPGSRCRRRSNRPPPRPGLLPRRAGRDRACVSLGKRSWPSFRRFKATPPCAAAFGKTSTPWPTCMSGRCCCRSERTGKASNHRFASKRLLQGRHAYLPPIVGQLAGPHEVESPTADAGKIGGHFRGQAPLGKLEGQEHPPNIDLGMGHDGLDGIEREVGRDVHIGGEPADLAKRPAGNFDGTAANVAELGIFKNRRGHFGRIDADDIKSPPQQ